MRALLVSLIGTVIFSGTCSAELIDRGGGLIYDTDLNVTWLKNANVISGNWQKVNALAASFEYFDSVRGVTYDDWRLPKVLIADATCAGPNRAYGCTGSEMGHLFHVELGNLGYYDSVGNPGQGGWGLRNIGPFEGLAALPYWSGTEWEQGQLASYFFEFNLGAQDAFLWGANLRAMLVRDGDVAAVQVVSEPVSLGLSVLGLAAFATSRLRLRRSHACSTPMMQSRMPPT